MAFIVCLFLAMFLTGWVVNTLWPPKDPREEAREIARELAEVINKIPDKERQAKAWVEVFEALNEIKKMEKSKEKEQR